MGIGVVDTVISTWRLLPVYRGAVDVGYCFWIVERVVGLAVIEKLINSFAGLLETTTNKFVSFWDLMKKHYIITLSAQLGFFLFAILLAQILE